MEYTIWSIISLSWKRHCQNQQKPKKQNKSKIWERIRKIWNVNKKNTHFMFLLILARILFFFVFFWFFWFWQCNFQDNQNVVPWHSRNPILGSNTLWEYTRRQRNASFGKIWRNYWFHLNFGSLVVNLQIPDLGPTPSESIPVGRKNVMLVDFLNFLTFVQPGVS